MTAIEVRRTDVLGVLVTLVACLTSSLPMASSSPSSSSSSSSSASQSSSSSEHDCRELKDDVASKAVVSPIIFEGRARRMEMMPVSWPSNPQNQKPFNVTFKPRTVYKGDLPRTEEGKDYSPILVGQFGPAEDLEGCIPSIYLGSRYIVFLKAKLGHASYNDEILPYYEISQFPDGTTKKAIRHVLTYGCPNCSFPPRIEPFIEARVNLLTSQRLVLHCVTSGKPIPVVTWFKNGNVLGNNSRRIHIRNKRDGSTLDIARVASQDSGLYRCSARNVLGEMTSDAVDVNITPSELEVCSAQGYCFNGGHCYVVPNTGRKICECQKNFTGVRCQEPNLMEHFLIMKQTYEFFERRLEGLVLTSILLIIILILLFFISVVCMSRRKSDCHLHGCDKRNPAFVHRSNVSTWNDSSVQTDRHYENVHMNVQPLSPRTQEVAATIVSPENPQRHSWLEKAQASAVVSSEACVIVGSQPPRPSGSVMPNKAVVADGGNKKNKCDECKNEEASKRCSSVFVSEVVAVEGNDKMLEMKTFRGPSQTDDHKEVKLKSVGCKLVNRDSGIDVRASRLTTTELIQGSELLELRLSESEAVARCEIDVGGGKEIGDHTYSNTPVETCNPVVRPSVVEILEQLRNNNDLQLVTPNKLSSILQACKEKEKFHAKSGKDVSCGCPDNSSSKARHHEEKEKMQQPTNLAAGEKISKRMSCNVEVQTDKRCKELLSQGKNDLQKRKSCYVISSAVNGVVFAAEQLPDKGMDNPTKNSKAKRYNNAVEPLNSVAEEEKTNAKVVNKAEKRKTDRGLKVSIETKPVKREHDKEETTCKNPEVPPKFSPSYQEVLKQCGNSLSDYKLNQKDIKLHKKRSESAFPFAGKEPIQEHPASGMIAERTKHGPKEYSKHRANSTSTDNSTSYNHFPQRNSKVIDNRPKTSSPIPNGHFQFFPSSQNEKEFISPPIPAKKFPPHFVKDGDRFGHRSEAGLSAHQVNDQQAKAEKYFSPPSIPSQNSRVSKIPLRSHEECHPLIFSNSKFQVNGIPDCEVMIEERKRPAHSHAPDLQSAAEMTSKASPQDAVRGSFRQSPLQSVAGLRNAFESMSASYKISQPIDQAYAAKAKPNYRLFASQLSSMIPVKDDSEITEGKAESETAEEKVLQEGSSSITNNNNNNNNDSTKEATGNEYDALYSTDERSISCSECDCRVSQASDLEVNRESEVDILTLNASEEELLMMQQKRQDRKIADKSAPLSREKAKAKYLSGSTFAKKCVELCRDNSTERSEKPFLEKLDSKPEARSSNKAKASSDLAAGEMVAAAQFRLQEDFGKRDPKAAPVASSDEYGESSADSSDSEDSSISSNEAERGIDMLFERLKLDHSDDLMAAVEALQSQRQSESSSERLLEFPSFDWEKAPCCPFSFESLDRTFTLNPYDLMYAHKYAASQSRVEPVEADEMGACAGVSSVGSPFRKNGELGLPSPPKFHFDFDSDTTVA